MKLDVGDTVYWNERGVRWTARVVSVSGGGLVCVWLRAGYCLFKPAAELQKEVEEADRLPFVDDKPVGPGEEQRHHH